MNREQAVRQIRQFLLRCEIDGVDRFFCTGRTVADLEFDPPDVKVREKHTRW